MKGRFRRDWMRCARRAGRMESVKFAELKRAWLESGGRPCLLRKWSDQDNFVKLYWGVYLTRSARVKGCSGRDASCAISSSVTVLVCKCLCFGLAKLYLVRVLRGQQTLTNCDCMTRGRWTWFIVKFASHEAWSQKWFRARLTVPRVTRGHVPEYRIHRLCIL